MYQIEWLKETDTICKACNNSGIGCHIGNHYEGGVGFAGDIKLLSPSNKGLQIMIYM